MSNTLQEKPPQKPKTEVEIIINPDGSCLIVRGHSHHNSVLRELFKDAKDPKALEEFLSVTDDSDILFGPSGLCG